MKFFMSRKKLLLIAAPFFIWILFATIYYYISPDFSYVDPLKQQNLNSFLTHFFSKVCIKGKTEAKVTIFNDGCRYEFLGNGIEVSSGNKPFYITKAFTFRFHSYSEHKLFLEYEVMNKWIDDPDRLPDEHGMLSIDLSLHDSIRDQVALQFMPYVFYQGFPVKEVPHESLSFNDTFHLTAWGIFLNESLLSVGDEADSITVGRGPATFVSKFKSDLFLQLKRYFENGDIYNSSFATFLYYSGTIMSCTALGDLVPNTPIARFLTIVEGLSGILLFGLIIGVFSPK